MSQTKRKYVGVSVKRKEDLPLLLGKGTYVDDIKIPGMFYVAFVRSPLAHARIKSIGTASAEKHPGVVYVMTGDEAVFLPSWMKFPGLRTVDRHSLAVGKVRFVGEPIAAVVATDPYVAHDAAELVTPELDPLPAVTDAEKALEPGAPLLYEDWGDNVLMRKEYSQGDVDGAFASADLVVSERLKSHRYAPTPIEPRGTVADYDRATGQLTAWSSTQFPHVLQTYLSQVLGLDENRVRVIAPRVGGGFGPKSSVYPEDVAVCQLAVKLGRPVKWMETRREHLLVCGHAREQVHYVEAAFRSDGTLLGIKDKVIADFGVYGTFWTESQPAMLSVVSLPGPYSLRNYAYDLYCVVTNKAPYAPHRGFGRPVGTYVMERVMDLAARRLGVDPAEIRMKNFIQPDEMPYKSVTGVIYDSGNYPEAMRRALEFAEYGKLREMQRRAREEGRHVGIGIAMYVEYTAPSSERLAKALGWEVGGYETATVKIEPSGKVRVYTGTVSQGQSHETIFSQIAADELGVSIDDVEVIQGDTRTCPYGFGAWASRSTVVAGGAIIRASAKVREKVLAIAAYMLEASPADLEIDEGRISVRGYPDRYVTLKDVATAAIRDPTKMPPGMEPGLEATVRYEPVVPTTCSYAIHIPVVEVDPETGHAKFLKYFVFDDSGRVVNPMTVYGQIHGAVAHGVGGTMLEELVYDESGQLLTSTFMDYLIPSATEAPVIEIDHMETPSPNPGGFKGMGEGGAIAAPGAVANAIEDALAPLGLKVTETPLNSYRIWRLIKASSRA